MGSRAHRRRNGRDRLRGRVGGRRAVGGARAHLQTREPPRGGRRAAARRQVGARQALRARRVHDELLADCLAAARAPGARHQQPHVSRAAARRSSPEPLLCCRRRRRRRGRRRLRAERTPQPMRTRVRLGFHFLSQMFSILFSQT